MIDDIKYSDFINNSLPFEEMLKIEQELIKEGEADSVLYSCMAKSVIHRDATDELLGADDIYSNLDDRIREGSDSNISEQYLNINIMNTKLSNEDILKVKELVEKFNQSLNAEFSFEENCRNFYLANRPGTTPEVANEIINEIKSGVEQFNNLFREALEKGEFDYMAELSEATKNLSIESKYEMYINLLAALYTINISNLTEDQKSQMEDFQTIKGHLAVEGTVTNDMVSEIEAKIADAIENNTLCLGSIDALRNMIGALPKGDGAIEAIANASENDWKEKITMSLAAVILNENNELESFAGSTISPAQIAVAVSAGVEESRVLIEVAEGKKTVEIAIITLKIIGAIALTAIMCFCTVAIVSGVTVFAFNFLVSLFGVSSVAVAISAILAFTSGIGVLMDLVKFNDKVYDKANEWFDIIINAWRTRAWPSVKETLNSIRSYLQSLFSNGKVKSKEEAHVVNPATVG